MSLLNRIIRNTFDRYGFPKSRNLRQLTLFLKYFILIREWLKESQNDIPEYLDEIIYHLGQAYNLISKGSKMLIEEFPSSEDFIDTKEKIEKI